MTYEEKTNRISTLWAMESALRAVWLGSDVWKLHALLTWFDPPESLAKHVRQKIQSLHRDKKLAGDLHEQVERAEDHLRVRPSLKMYISFVDGQEKCYVEAGMLPDFQKASENEVIALQQLKEFYEEEKANEDMQNLRQGVRPF